MAADNLTQKFKDELKKRGIVTKKTDAEIEDYLSSQGVTNDMFQTGSQQFEQPGTRIPPSQLLGLGTEQKGDDRSKLLDFVGSAVWHGVDTAALGIPGYALGEKAPYKWEDLEAGGKAGAVVGGALGFFAPMGVIGKGSKLAVSTFSKAGTKKLIGESAEKAGKFAANVPGVTKEVSEEIIKKTLKGPIVAKQVLPRYSTSLKNIEATDDLLIRTLGENLKVQFPSVAQGALDDIGRVAVQGLKDKGVHVNNIASYVEKALGTTMYFGDKVKINRYAGRALNTAADFAIYNLLTDGITSMATDKEFSPGSDVYQALAFASLLPAVHMIPGGGKTRLLRDLFGNRFFFKDGFMRQIRQLKKKSKDGFFRDLTDKQAEGWLKVIGRDNRIGETIVGSTARKAIDHKGVLEKIIKDINPNKLYADYTKYAAGDLAGSMGRMLAGGFYFNSHTFLDYDLLKHSDHEELITHFLVGMMFTKSYRPLTPKETPHLTDFEQRAEAMKYFNYDISEVEAYSRAIDSDTAFAMAYSGLAADPVVKEIMGIFNTEANIEQTKNPRNVIKHFEHQDRLVRFANELYKMNELATKMDHAEGHVDRPTVELSNLTREQINAINQRIKKISITLHKKKQHLNEENYHDFSNELFKGVQKAQAELYVRLAVETMKDFGATVDVAEGWEFDFDKPIRIGTFSNVGRFNGNKDYADVMQILKIVNRLEEAGFVDRPEELDSERLSIDAIDKSKFKKAREKVKMVMERLVKENYGPGVDYELNPTDNGFLLGITAAKRNAINTSLFNIVQGNTEGMSESHKSMRRTFEKAFGNESSFEFSENSDMLGIKMNENGKPMNKDREDILESSDGVGGVTNLLVKLRHAAEMWGQGKSQSKSKIWVDYDVAKALVEKSESELGVTLTKESASMFRRMFWSRILETADINPNVMTALEIFQKSSIARFDIRDGRTFVSMPDLETVKSIIDSYRNDTSEIKQSEQNKLISDYERILEHLGSINPKYLNLTGMRDLGKRINPGDLIEAINSVYVTTVNLEKDVIEHFEKGIGVKGQENVSFLARVNDLINTLRADEESGMKFRDIGIEESVDLTDRFTEFIKESEKIAFSDPETIKIIEQLRDKFAFKSGQREGEHFVRSSNYESVASAIEKFVREEISYASGLTDISNQIVFDTANSVHDRIMGQRRLDLLNEELFNKLEHAGVKFEKEKKYTLDELTDIWTKNRSIKELFDILEGRLYMWRKSLSESEWHEYIAREKERYSSFDLHDINEAPRYSADFIPKNYSQYHESFTGQSWTSRTENLRAVIEKGDTKAATAQVKEVVTQLEEAIRRKHELPEIAQTTEELKGAAKDEFETVVKEILPNWVAQTIGSRKILSGELQYNKHGEPIIVQANEVAGEAAYTIFADSMAKNGIHIIKLAKIGVVDNQKRDIYGDKKLDEILMDARFYESQEEIARAMNGETKNSDKISSLKGLDHMVRVITSYNTQMLVGIDNLSEIVPGTVKGKLSNVFGKWYDKKVKEFKDKDTKESLEALKGFKNIFEDLSKVEVIQSRGDVRHAIRAMYWDGISQEMFNDYLRGAQTGSKYEFMDLVSRTFKYNQLAESMGAKRKGSSDLINIMKDSIGHLFSSDLIDSIDYYNKKGKFDVVAIGDEILKGLHADRLVEEGLDIMGKDEKKKRVTDPRDVGGDIFTTAKGSVYAVDGTRTTRTKADRDEHPGDFGLKDKSTVTLYMDQITAQNLFGKPFGAMSRSKKKVLGFNKLGITLDGKTYGAKSKPTKGLLPVELWRDADGNLQSYHVGNKIIEITKGAQPHRTGHHDPKTMTELHISEQRKTLEKQLKSLVKRSAVDSQTYLGTHAARVQYLNKGRYLDEGDIPDSHATAGVKNVAWLNDPKEGTIFLKTNMIYDPKIAEIMDKLGIDILTTESAAKKFNKNVAAIKVKEVEGLKTLEDILNASSSLANRKSLEVGKNLSSLRLEDLFIGKSEDRKSLTSITYALTDFMDNIAFASHLNEFVGYEKKVEGHIGKLSHLYRGGTGAEVVATQIFKELRDEGAIVDQSASALTEALLNSKLHPDQSVIREDIKTAMVKRIVNTLRKPSTPGSSYSILKPYIEGSLPVYTNDGKQILIGGKKLSAFDAETRIENYDDVSYIVNYYSKTLGSRDLHLARIKGGKKWVIKDPYGEVKIEDVQHIIDGILKRENSGKYKTLGQMHNVLNSYNNRKKTKNKIWLSSLSLRMPNLGADVAIHKVEGFYSKIEGNVVGINMIDLATIHQADFDVDALFNLHDAPGEVVFGAAKINSLALDARVYESTTPRIDPFGNGASNRRAGSSLDDIDGMSGYVEDYYTAQKNFGIIKRLSTGVSAIARLKEISFNMNGDQILPMNTSEGAKFGPWIQRYKNVLQSIIDSTKKPNVVSSESSDNLVRWILFGESFGEIGKSVEENASKYGEENWEAFFTGKTNKGVLNKLDVDRRFVSQDVIMEVISTMSRSTRFLSDVFDPSGRRPPNANEIAGMRSEYLRFRKNPNQHVFESLLAKYSSSGEKNKVTELVKMFYGTDQSPAKLINEYYKNKKGIIGTTVSVINMNSEKGNDGFYKYSGTAANNVIERFVQNKAEILGYDKKINKDYSAELESVTGMLDNIETFSGLLGHNTYEKFVEQLEGKDADEAVTAQFTNMLPDSANYTANHVQNYSILYTILESNKRQLQKSLMNVGKYKSGLTTRMNRRLRIIDSVLEFVRRKEDSLFQGLETAHYLEGKKEITDVQSRLNSHFNTVIVKGERKYKNLTNNIQYVYVATSTKRGVPRFRKAGYVLGRKTMKLDKTKKYIILKNPVRYSNLSSSETADGWSMFLMTARVTAESMPGLGRSEEVRNNFIRESQRLRTNFSDLARHTYEMSKESPYAAKNWMFETKIEDTLIRDFMLRFRGKEFHILDADSQNKVIANLALYLMKPSPVFGNVTKSNNDKIALPTYKINKRLTRAVLRFLKNEGSEFGFEGEIFHELTAEWGRNFRRVMYNVIPESSAFISSIYDKPKKTINYNSPMFHMIYELGLGYKGLYHSAFLEFTRYDIARYKDKPKEVRDEDGVYSLLTEYGTMADVKDHIEYYRNPRNLDGASGAFGCR